MKLFVREWGDGDSLAVLVHGVQSGSRAWWRVGPALASYGYRVLAVDLPGHGASPRAPDYPPELFAESLIESVPTGPDLAIGHSLGGLTLALAVDALQPRRAVYSDPAFRLPKGPGGVPLTDTMVAMKRQTRAQVAELHPGWTEDEIEVEIATLKDWDVQTAISLSAAGRRDFTPVPLVPSLVQIADPSFMVPPAFADELTARGFEVRIVKGAEHTIHRHLIDDFMTSLDGWL